MALDDKDDLLGDFKLKLDKPLKKRSRIETPYDRALDNGVNITWLMNAFHMSRDMVKSKLANCPKAVDDAESPLYYLHEAVHYLGTPAGGIEEAIKRMKPSQMPVLLQKAFWEAKNERVKYEVQAKNLWRTEDVLMVFASCFKIIRDTIFLWLNDIERLEALTDKQKEIILEKCDSLQDAIYNNLKKHSESNSSGSLFDVEDSDD